MVANSLRRWTATGLVILLPVLVMAFLGQVGFKGYGQPWDWMTLLVVWFVGIVTVWTRAQKTS